MGGKGAFQRKEGGGGGGDLCENRASNKFGHREEEGALRDQ